MRKSENDLFLSVKHIAAISDVLAAGDENISKLLRTFCNLVNDAFRCGKKDGIKYVRDKAKGMDAKIITPFFSVTYFYKIADILADGDESLSLLLSYFFYMANESYNLGNQKGKKQAREEMKTK